ncbi:MAG TPA: hypothetical protein VN821_09170 [Candidatus Udaeobacter sp.]|nr:hypothetical protein [Candidatus Udaeobacter sp.]
MQGLIIHQAAKNVPSKTMANWVFAALHSRGAICQSRAGGAEKSTPIPDLPQDMELASEAFVSNSLIELKPLANLDDSAFAPGPVAAKLAQLYGRLPRDR